MGNGHCAIDNDIEQWEPQDQLPEASWQPFLHLKEDPSLTRSPGVKIWRKKDDNLCFVSHRFSIVLSRQVWKADRQNGPRVFLEIYFLLQFQQSNVIVRCLLIVPGIK